MWDDCYDRFFLSTADGPVRSSGSSGARLTWIRALCVLAAIAVTMSVLSYHLHYRVVRKEAGIKPGQINDLDRWMRVVPPLVEQRARYESDTFPNPPPALLILYPLTKLPHARAQVVWAWAKAFMAAAIFLLCLAMVRDVGLRLRPATMALTLTVWLWSVVGDLQAGQTNLLMLLPLVAGLRLAQPEEPARTWLAGLLIALAVAIKVTPLALLPYALFRRRWRLAAAIALGLCVWVLVIPSLAFGWEQNWRWLGQWGSIMITPYLTHGEVAYLKGYSLPSLVPRLLRRVPAYTTLEDGVRQPHYINLVELPEPVVAWITRGLILAIAVAGAVWAGRSLPTFRSKRYLMELGCLAVFMLWASERTWMPHYVTLVLTLFAVAMILSDAAQPLATRRRACLALGLSAVLLVFTSDVADVLPGGVGLFVSRLAPPFWVSVLLVSVICTARRG